MAIAAAIVIVPLGVLFFVSGLVINFIQAVCFLLIRPLSKKTYRRINREVAGLLWLELVWLIDWWAGVKIELYTDSETFKLMGKEHALVICNHKSDIDWLVGWVLAERSGCLGSSLAVMKKSSKFLPVIGWSMWFSEYLFLERSWAKDESTLKSGPTDFPRPFWLALFSLRVLASRRQNFYCSRICILGRAISKKRLIPRTKVHVHLKRHLMKDLPETDEAVAQWCRDAFVAKDKLLDKHIDEDSFGEQLQDTSRPLKSLLVVCSWAILLILGTLKVIQRYSLLSSRKGAALSAIALAVVTILMQILIQFSQSERSTPAKVAPSKSRNGVEPSRAN
ncbi:UNVERIFIED_CONTAM: 1-acyl-sn-glycerol-3-phosphate acyltransferase 2 [Sesamum calycinum]|uniref:1-acylglycerol-3-phosphate O-acyltransferase n=1 Tax=Sesamum calycinum TaxID=2727403 RepID=A0AAW2RTR0_9LAMI